MSSYFPVILIPQSIKEALASQLPPVPVFKEPLPQQPGAPPRKLNTPVVAVQTAVAVPVIPVAAKWTSIPEWVLFLAAFGAIATSVWRQLKSYPQRKQEHDRKAKDYPRKLEDYERKKLQHSEKVKAANDPKRIAEFRYKLIREILRKTISHDGNGSTARKGASEARFKSHLNNYFSSKIKDNLTLKISDDYKYPYTPDFAYIDNSLNLHIDIEIDEPYVYRTGQPTHFHEASKDNNRNNFFLARKWIVIRFSEEQVVRHPKKCCKTIAQVISDITGNRNILNQFANIPDLQMMKHWSETEAMKMATSNYRDKYL